MQPDVMFPNDPVESREQMLRDNCDQIEQRSFTRSFSQDEVYARRAELEQVSIQVAELEDELAQIRADIKGRIKPLLERRGKILDELKSRGEWVTADTFKFVDVEDGTAAYYSGDGYKIEERPITPEERQGNIIQATRFFNRTGTDD